MIEKISLALHALIERLCLSLIAGLLCSQLMIVVLRYVYGIGFLKLQDFSAYCFSALVTLSVVYTFVRNAHVRVDVLRERQSEPFTRYFDCAAMLFLLLPVFALTLYWAWPDILYTWSILEGS
ncbi:MAG: TRAP transporter small permease subunit, partial [Pseudomonadales bacterium]